MPGGWEASRFAAGQNRAAVKRPIAEVANGSRRVHAKLTLGRGISVGYHAVELLMRRAGLQGATGPCQA